MYKAFQPDRAFAPRQGFGRALMSGRRGSIVAILILAAGLCASLVVPDLALPQTSLETCFATPDST